MSKLLTGTVGDSTYFLVVILYILLCSGPVLLDSGYIRGSWIDGVQPGCFRSQPMTLLTVHSQGAAIYPSPLMYDAIYSVTLPPSPFLQFQCQQECHTRNVFEQALMALLLYYVTRDDSIQVACALTANLAHSPIRARHRKCHHFTAQNRLPSTCSLHNRSSPNLTIATKWWGGEKMPLLPSLPVRMINDSAMAIYLNALALFDLALQFQCVFFSHLSPWITWPARRR